MDNELHAPGIRPGRKKTGYLIRRCITAENVKLIKEKTLIREVAKFAYEKPET